MFQYVDHMAVADLGGGGSGGCNLPKSSEPYVQNALLILCLGIDLH